MRNHGMIALGPAIVGEVNGFVEKHRLVERQVDAQWHTAIEDRLGKENVTAARGAGDCDIAAGARRKTIERAVNGAGDGWLE